MKTYKEYMDKFYATGEGIERYLKRYDIVDMKMAHLIIGGSMTMEELEEWDNGIIQAKTPTDVLDGQGTYETIGKDNKFDPFRYYGQCMQGKNKNVNPVLGRRIYVCSPFYAESAEEILRNTKFATDVCETIVKEGDYPIAPHLYFTRFLNDAKEEEREFGIMAGLQLMKYCDEIAVYTFNGALSEGMKRELIYNANNLGLPVTKFDFKREKR